MWRGDDPIVRDMRWYVYNMWSYMVELGAPSQETCSTLRCIEIKVAPHYHLHRTHAERLATESRVQASPCLLRCMMQKQRQTAAP